VDRTPAGVHFERSPMAEPDRAAIIGYVHAASVLQGMPLAAERELLVADVVERLARFAADLAAFSLADDVEPAGTFRP